jgi:hypothetical protein
LSTAYVRSVEVWPTRPEGTTSTVDGGRSSPVQILRSTTRDRRDRSQNGSRSFDAVDLIQPALDDEPRFGPRLPPTVSF